MAALGAESQQPVQWPADIQRQLAQARHKEWLTLALRASAVVVLYGVLGSSQALEAVWLKSLWALLPPAAFLVAVRLESRPSSQRFPYGFHRAGSIAFLSSALALTGMGLYLLAVGTHSLIVANPPHLVAIAAAGGWLQWPGDWIIAALAYSIAVPWIIGWRRQRLAVALHDKGLYADASMSRFNWLSSTTAIIGVLGIGLGFWRLDFIATVLISLDIIRHGLRHLRAAAADLMDEMPRRIGRSEIDPLGERIGDYLRGRDWIVDARVRLREHGRLLTGEALICPLGKIAALDRLEAARAQIETMDWRLRDFQLVPVCQSTLRRHAHNRAESHRP